MEITNIHFKHILYATDFSETAKCAGSYAKSIADQYGATVTLLYVIKEELSELLIFDAGNERTPSGVSNRLVAEKDHFAEEREEVIASIREEYGKPAIGINDIVVERGNPVKVIVRVAEKLECDLIVMGAKGRSTTLEDMLMGDTVRRVLIRTKIPVLVIQNPNKQ